jgi:mediator of RNA polymerase II transcription subunit 17
MQRLRPARETNSANTPRVPPVLQPIIGLLQYQVFCRRIKSELDKVTRALAVVSIISSLRFNPVGETGQDLLDLIDKGESRLMSGEALIRIDNRCASKTMFFQCTILSPSVQLWHTLVV